MAGYGLGLGFKRNELVAAHMISPFLPSDVPNLVAAFEAHNSTFSAKSDGDSLGTYTDPYTSTTFGVIAGAATKQTYRSMPVLHLGSGCVIQCSKSFDSSFDTALTVVIVEWSDVPPASNKITISDGTGILGALALTENTIGTNADRVSSWFGVQGSVVAQDAQFNAGQVATWRYDGSNVRINRNKYEGPSVAKTGNLGLTGHITLGDATNSFVGNIRAVYVFNRVITDTELGNLVTYAATQSAKFVGNNTYLCMGDSQTTTSGGTVAYPELLRADLNSESAVYNHLFAAGIVGFTIDGFDDAALALYVDNYVSSPTTSEFETAIIWLGTNDIRSEDLTAAQALSNMTVLLSKLSSRGFNRFMLLGCLPFDGAPFLTEVAAYNAGLSAMADGVTIKYIPIQEDSRLNPQTSEYYDTIDGVIQVHCNDAGKAVVAELVLPQLIPWLAAAPVNTAAPTVGPATPSNGSSVSVVHGVYDNYPSSYSYRWFANGVVIAGETSQNYIISQSDGVVITAAETGHNIYGDSAETLSSNSAIVTPFSFIRNEDFEGAGTPSGWTGSANFNYLISPIDGLQSCKITAGNTAGTLLSAGPYTSLFQKFRLRVDTNGGGTGYIYSAADNSFAETIRFFLTSTGTILTGDFTEATTDSIVTGTDYYVWIDYDGTTAKISFNTSDSKPTSGTAFASYTLTGSIYVTSWMVSAGHEIVIDDVQVATSSF